MIYVLRCDVVFGILNKVCNFDTVYGFIGFCMNANLLFLDTLYSNIGKP